MDASDRSEPVAERCSITKAGLAVAGVNVALATLFLAFAWSHLNAFRANPRLSVALIVIVEAILAVFVLIRAPSKECASGSWAVVTTAFGTFLPLAVRPTASIADSTVGQGLQTIGAVAILFGALSLNRCFGLLPAYRGLRTGGAYRIVRHPLYAAYLFSWAGYLASNTSLWNVVVALVALGFQLERIRNEEAVLSRYPEYRAYCRQTRYRLVPFVF